MIRTLAEGADGDLIVKIGLNDLLNPYASISSVVGSVSWMRRNFLDGFWKIEEPLALETMQLTCVSMTRDWRRFKGSGSLPSQKLP